MRFQLVVLLLSAVAISAKITSDFKPRPKYGVPQLSVIKSSAQFKDIVNYLEYNLSPKDIEEMVGSLPEALDAIDKEFSVDAQKEQQLVAEPRSVGSAIGNAFEHIPWGKIVDVLQKMSRSDSKFSKILNLVNDQKFRDLVKRAVNSHTLGQFVKDVAEHGFSWTEFLHLLLHALCSTATTIQHDKYSVGVCQVLQHI